MNSSFANWFMILDGCHSNLSILRTLREASDADTRKLMRKYLSQDTLDNKDQMAVAPVILELADPSFTAILEILGVCSVTLVSEKRKWTNNNKVGTQ